MRLTCGNTAQLVSSEFRRSDELKKTGRDRKINSKIRETYGLSNTDQDGTIYDLFGFSCTLTATGRTLDCLQGFLAD